MQLNRRLCIGTFLHIQLRNCITTYAQNTNENRIDIHVSFMFSIYYEMKREEKKNDVH